MFKVAINPTWVRPDKADGGIRRVSEAQWKYLPQFGVEPVRSYTEADLIATHGTARAKVANKPIVSHCHGLYWSVHEWPDWAHEANRQVVESMAQAVAHSAPSEWVSNALRRGMMVYPEVIHHGIDADIWKPPDEWDSYVLWNKARADPVSNPNDMQRLATFLPEVKFVSTLGQETDNVQTIGVMTIDEIYDWIQHAGLYLCTARETFGIGTLEAMACGVPVVGWDWGGQSEIIIHEETGFLAKPHDYEALADGIRWAISERENLGSNARQDVLDRWGWEPRIKQYAELYRRTKSWWDRPERKISVLVTCHNLGKYLSDCLRSVAEQGYEDWECIIIDDASTDETEHIAKQWEQIDGRFRYIKTPKNLKLPGARNFGFSHSKGRYILPLDADDMLAPHALVTLSGSLDVDANIHIAYGHLDTIKEDGSNQQRSSWPFEAYSWHGQMAHLNQLPYSSMMRREVMERTGGYRVRNWRAEDAELWIRATSFGFRAAKVTQATTLIYRWRSDSKTTGEESDGDWTAWYPWRLGAETGHEGMKIFRGLKGATHPRPDLVPWSSQGFPSSKFWPVPDCTNPVVSVVVPVGPKHGEYVIDALDSLMAQTYTEWEAIVVNATGEKWGYGFESPVAGAPWARVVDAGKQVNPATARNLGAEYVKGSAILWLDADDILLATAMEEMLELHLGTDGGIIYTDILKAFGDPGEPLELHTTPEFKCGDVVRVMQHAMMCMTPAWAHKAVGGFDESLPGWEDWDYLIALQDAGICSYRLEKPGFIYRFFAGAMREDNFDRRAEIKPRLREKWRDYAEGKKAMPCSGCPGKSRRSVRRVAKQPLEGPQDPSVAVLLEYQGKRDKINMRGPSSGTYYRFRPGEQKYVMAQDAQHFLTIRRKGIYDFVRVAQPVELPAAKAETFIQADVVESQAPPEYPKMMEETKIEMPRTIKELRKVIRTVPYETVSEWLTEEINVKNRKTALKLLQHELDRR